MADTEETIEDIEETAEEEALEAGGPRRKLLGPTMVRTLLYIVAALVLIVVSGTIAYFVAKKVGTAPATEKTSPQFEVKTKPYAYFSLESFSINTSDVDEPHFVKVTLELGYEKTGTTVSELQTELNERRPQIRDIVIRIVGSKHYSDLDSPDGRQSLRDEIKRRINDKLMNGEIREVVFTEFVLT
jgi:flagellar FliL protein